MIDELNAKNSYEELYPYSIKQHIQWSEIAKPVSSEFECIVSFLPESCEFDVENPSAIKMLEKVAIVSRSRFHSGAFRFGATLTANLELTTDNGNWEFEKNAIAILHSPRSIAITIDIDAPMGADTIASIKKDHPDIELDEEQNGFELETINIKSNKKSPNPEMIRIDSNLSCNASYGSNSVPKCQPEAKIKHIFR